MSSPAYLTNPSENSFRAYLTEQSFRHHLSRLDDNLDDLQSIHNGTYHRQPSNRSELIPPSHCFIDSSPFYFANRASICLRTPKHVFHSFTIFTIAAMIPYSKPCDGEHQDAWMISDAWYIGAFGKWWRGGALEAWYQDVIARSKDKGSWTSGILSMKPLEDILPGYTGTFDFFIYVSTLPLDSVPFFSTAGFKANFAPGEPPKLKNREQPTPRQSIARPRSSTPPPLPKSVSLPLHTIQRPLTNNAQYSCDRLSKMKSSPPRPCLVNDRHGTCSTQPRSSEALLEHSPLLDEVLRQITNSKESVHDIHTQITECQLVTTRSYAVLQREVETYRERKQQEDAARLELKSRIKLLDDSKRGAEGAKKDADKNFKAVQLIRDNTGHHLESLQEKILALQGHLLEDRDFILCYQKHSLEPAINETLQQKKADIRAAEHSVAILNQRSRELEDRLSSERERLRILRQKSEDQRLYYPFLEDIDPQHDGRRFHPLPFVMPGDRAALPVTPAFDSQLLHYPRNGPLYHSCGDAYVGNAKNIIPEVHQDALSDGSQETFRSFGSEVVSIFGSGMNVSRDDSSGTSGDTDPGTEMNWYGNLDPCNHRHQGDCSSFRCSYPPYRTVIVHLKAHLIVSLHRLQSEKCSKRH